MVDWAIDPPAPMASKLEEAVDQLKEMVEKGTNLQNQHKTFQPPEEIPLDIQDRPLHPDHPSDTDLAIVYRHEFATGGFAGLAKAVQNQAELNRIDPRVTPSLNYAIVDDDNSIHLMMILASMYPGFIQGLIDGDIYSKYAENQDLRRALDLTHNLKKIPGNYLQGFVQNATVSTNGGTSTTASTQADQRIENDHKFRGLTFTQLCEMYVTSGRYLPSNANRDINVIKAIDRMYQPVSKNVNYSSGQHKYVQKGTNETKFEVWMDELEKTYIKRIVKMRLKNPNDPILEIPMRVSFLEIGWGQDARARASAHDDHRSSNQLFTFFQAVMKYMYKENGITELPFHIERQATNLLNRGNSVPEALLDARLADVAITMIGRTEWFTGGLNPQPGGGGGVQEAGLKERLPYIQEQAERMYSKGSRFEIGVRRDCEKIKELTELELMTNQDFVDREEAVEKTRKDQEARFEKVKEELKDLEDIKTVHIAEDLAHLGEFDDGRLRLQDNDAFSLPGLLDFQGGTLGNDDDDADLGFISGVGRHRGYWTGEDEDEEQMNDHPLSPTASELLIQQAEREDDEDMEDFAE